MYPSIHWAGGVCISACTGQGGGSISQHALGKGCLPRVWGVCPGCGVSAQGVGYLPRVWGICPGCGVSAQGVGCLPGGVCLPGGYLPGGVCQGECLP